MRVLVTGHRGYLGSVLVGVLRNACFDVAGLDCDLYEGCDFGRVRTHVPDFEVDLRDIEFTDLLSFDAVVHLAELPRCPSTVRSTPSIDDANVSVTVRLAECCKQAKVPRLLFASSCAVYGRARGMRLDEHSPANPTTTHAATKLCCEQELVRLADATFAPIILRNPVAYGVSPRLRLDLLVNDFVGAAVTDGHVSLKTDGRVWRPLLHVEDIARTYAKVLSASHESVGHQIFNVVHTKENHRVATIADAVCEHVPGCTWNACVKEFDEASYRVDGEKLKLALPELAFRWNLPLGIRQLRTAMIGAGLTYADWRSDRYRREARLTALLESGRLTSDMKRADPILSIQRKQPETRDRWPAQGTLYKQEPGAA
jgi:nucleoside-diphosphate-sugar epimerase